VATAEFNSDGKPDLVVTNGCPGNSNCGIGSIGVLLGNGDGTLQQAVNYSSGGQSAVALAVGDFNGDRQPDVVVVNECSTSGCQNGTISVLLGNGDGTLRSPITSATGGVESWSLAVGDFNGDGKLDVAVANYYADTTDQSSSVSVLLGNGDGTFQTPVTYTLSGLYNPSIAVGDFDGDGKLDLAVSNKCQSTGSCVGVVSILKGNGDGTFQTPQTYPSAGGNTVSVAVGDFNGDGNPDLALEDDTDISVLLGNGDGTFQAAVSYPTTCCISGISQSLLVRDFNGDGNLDLAATTYQGGVCLLLGKGDGTFQTSTFYAAGSNDSGLAVVDLNNDGRPDLAIADGSSPGFVTVLLNIISGFRNATSTAVTSSANPAPGGQSVTFTATVTPSFSGLPPTGTVTFYDGPNVLDTCTLSGNQATFTTSSLILGAHSITASYGADTNFLPSTSPVLKENITSSPTTTTLSSSLNPSTYGQPVTLTASVTSSGPGTPTGTVTFADGANTIGASPLSSGQATLSTNALGAGGHSITATYSGDSNFNASSSSPLSQTVNQARTTLVLTSSVNRSVYNQAVVFTATITPQFGGQGTGTLAFVDQSGRQCNGAVSSNVATCIVQAPFLATGNNSVTAMYPGDSNFGASTSAPLTQVVNQATTTNVLTSSLNPAYVTQSITFTATVTGQYGGLATGSVTFKAGSTTLGTAILNGSGQASLTASFSTTGVRSITVIYAGDVNYKGSSSVVLVEMVNKSPTTTILGSSQNPSLVGQPVIFTATVSATYGSVPNGDKVIFKDGSTVLTTVALSGGTATYSTSSLIAGTHTINASYQGDSSFNTSTTTFNQVVNKYSSSTAVTSSLNPSSYGQAVTFTATVSGGAGTPTGTVTFKNSGSPLGTSTLSAGTASLTTSALNVGTRSITTVYSGDSTYLGDTSPALNQQVNKITTTITITSSPNSSASGQSVTFTATVMSAAGVPSGTVTFKSGATVLGTATLDSSGVASISTSTLPAGSDPITAIYGGNNFFASAASTIVQQVGSGGGVGTWTLVQTAHCTTAASSNTCSIPVSPNLEAGNLHIFGCNVQAGVHPHNFVASVSAGGTLVKAIAASTGSGNQISVGHFIHYILPSTSTGGVSPIVVTFANNASSANGVCLLEEWAPSQNGAGVAIDNDSAFVPSAAGTSNTNINLIQSGGNEVCFQQFLPSSLPATVSAISSPYDTNAFFASSTTGGGFSGALTGGVGPTWTSQATIPVLSAACFGWNTLPFSTQSFVDFESGTNGHAPTSTTLATDTHGWQGIHVHVTGSNILYDTSASMPLLNSTGRLGDGASYAAGAGSLGVTYTGTGTAINPHLTFGWGVNSSQTVVTAAVKFTSDVLDSDTSNVDCFSIHGATDFAAVNCYAAGGHRYFGLETVSGNGPTHVVASPSTACGSIGCTIVLQYQAGAGTVANTHTMWIYDQTGALLGTTSHASSTALDYPQYVNIGPAGNMVLTSGKHFKWDSLQVSLTSSVPNM
jgi:hypothetical protein